MMKVSKEQCDLIAIILNDEIAYLRVRCSINNLMPIDYFHGAIAKMGLDFRKQLL